MVVCNCSMFCCTLLYVHSSFAIILRGKRELVALLSLSSWCLVMVERLFLVVPWGCLRFVIVVFPDHTHLLFFNCKKYTLHHFLQCKVLLHVTQFKRKKTGRRHGHTEVSMTTSELNGIIIMVSSSQFSL